MIGQVRDAPKADGQALCKAAPLADTVPGMDEPRIKVYGSATEITIAANAAGLRDLAERFIGLADPDLHKGYHEHLDPGLALEHGTICLILARDDRL